MSDLLESLGLQTVYLGCAAVGGGLMILQLLLSMVFGADSDVDVDMDSPEGAGGLSVRAVIAFLTFFGLAGMAALSSGLGSGWSAAIALASGATAFFMMAFLLRQFDRLRSSGNVEIENALGSEARVYLKVPAEFAGEGKVTVGIQGRTVEYRAVTAGRELSTGEFCRVVEVRGSNTLTVEAMQSGEKQ